MLLQQIDELLRLYLGKKIEIKVYDDIFGTYNDEINYDGFEIDLNKIRFSLNSVENKKIFTSGEIIDINVVLDEEERIEMIYNAKSLKEAFEIGKEQLTPRVEQALDYMRDKFKATPQEQESKLKSLIQVKINSKRLNLTASEVLSHLLINSIGTRKIEQTLDNDLLYKLHDKVDETIEKLEKEIF